MKQQKKWRERLASVVMMLALTAPLVLVAISIGETPTLAFKLADMQMREDGSVQLLFSVGLEHMDSVSSIWAAGAQFNVNYNADYMVPSDYDTNVELRVDEQGANPNSNLAFRYNPELYQAYQKDGTLAPADPFEKGILEENLIDVGSGKLSMNLFIDQTISLDDGVGLEGLRANEEGVFKAFDQEKWRGKDIILGSLSFRVDPENLNKLPDMVKKFGGIEDKENPVAQDGTMDHLLWYEKWDATVSTWGTGPWSIRAFRRDGSNMHSHIYLDNSKLCSSILKISARSAFTFQFPKIIIGVEAAEAELTLNAYQAYTTGQLSDVPAALVTYSPTLQVLYSDGSLESVVMPWSRDSLPWTDCVVNRVKENGTTEVVTPGDYDPRGGVYLVDKSYCYQTTEADSTGGTVTVDHVFPVPVTVKLTVTPITLLDVTADDLSRSYLLENGLVTGSGSIQSVTDLALPSEARLATDVPPGPVTLTMPIGGWSHSQFNGYWPSGDYDTNNDLVPGTGTGTRMGDLWKDIATDPALNLPESSGAYHHWPTAEDRDKWAQDDGASGRLVGRNRAGDYTFAMAGTYGGAPTHFTRTEINTAYPWLTVPDSKKGLALAVPDPEAWPLDDAKRRIVWNGDPDDPKKLEDKGLYEVVYVENSTITGANGQPQFTLEVRKKGAGGNYESLRENSYFRIKLPDGTEMGINLTDIDGVTLPDWFDGNTNGSYTADQYMINTDRRAYHLTTNSGDPTTGVYGSEREVLRRYINLGGWFSVAINEDPASYYWSDFIPVYVPPRPNYYTESKEYNFIGDNTGLYPWSGGLNTTVVLPSGDYPVVDQNGVPVTGTTGEQVKERYGVSTTYDGATGAQPGELRQFTIYGTDASTYGPWVTSSYTTTPAGEAVRQYGANEFRNNTVYPLYGLVLNQNTNPNAANYTATVRLPNQPAPQPEVERITLTYEGPPASILDGTDGNVQTVIYDTRNVGYTTRQDYTLTITNVGTVPVSGLTIDLMTDIDSDGGHYVLLKPPASFLAPGEKTTFTLTYVYNLDAPGGTKEYRDRLFITSNSKHKSDSATGYLGEGQDYLLDFDARFQVTQSKIHRVYVHTVPAEGMGTGQVIVGLRPDTGKIDTSPTSNMFVQGDTVYVMADPEDEYVVKSVEAVDAAGNSIAWAGPTSVTLADGTTAEAYSFTMPDYDVTVTITFEEPISSKLRLSNLQVFAAPEIDENGAPLKTYAYDPDPKDYEYTLWRKEFTPQEKNDAAAAYPGETERQSRRLMTQGTAVKAGFESSWDQYLVVLPADAEYAQVQATLRKVVLTLNGLNPDLKDVNVLMNLYETADAAVSNAPADATGTNGIVEIYSDHAGDTSVPTKHLTEYTPAGDTLHTFRTPKPGDSKYVRVEINIPDEDPRYYYIELHRKPLETIATLNYGNSPYGMIMNDPNITDKAEAKRRFRANRYSFDGLDSAYVPTVVTDNGLQGIHYWTEAWVAPDAVYEPESSTGLALYDAAQNLDLSDTAFFAVAGAPFLDPGLKDARDSTGRFADLSDATISLTAYTLDVDASTQLERFALPTNPDDLANRTITLKRDRKVGSLVTAEWSGSDTDPDLRLRPGRYQLTYTFRDYDHTEEHPSLLTKTRDFVVLAPVGDVNADLLRLNDQAAGGKPSDESLMKGRVTQALGYFADQYPDGAILKLRVCDTNNDRNINNIDANCIREDLNNAVKQYYLPVNYKPAATP